MPLNVRLDDLPVSRIGAHLLTGGIQALHEITNRNHAKTTPGGEPQPFKNRKEEMKRRLMERDETVSFEQATDVVGRERLVISLYLDVEDLTHPAAQWLPAFAESTARSVLGSNGREWHLARRRQATSLFFKHFNHLPALEQLCSRLLEAYRTPEAHASSLTTIWHQQRLVVFAPDGPKKITAAAKDDESLSELMERFAVPKEGRFSARLKEVFLLTCLEAVELGQGQAVLQELEAMKFLPYQAGVPLGAAALRIMTRRVLESKGEWRGDWADWILRLGCDPGLPRTSEPFGKWWGCWNPTRAELECAQRGVNRQTLEYFIQFLKESLSGTGGYDQFEARAGFLRWLDDTRKIICFKLLLHPSAFQSLPLAYRQQRHRVAKIEGSGQGTSVIVMECIDDVWIAEGTHSFAIRAFRNKFPLPDVFLQNRTAYSYGAFTQGSMHKETCTGIWKAHMGDWINDLLWKMQREFHIEPPWRYR